MSRPLRQRPARKRQQHPERFGALPRRSGDLGHLQRSACVPMQTLLCRHEYSLIYVRLLADRYHRSCALAPNNRHHPEHGGALSRRPGYLVHLPGSACVEKVYCDLLVDRPLRSLGLAPSVRFLSILFRTVETKKSVFGPGTVSPISWSRRCGRVSTAMPNSASFFGSCSISSSSSSTASAAAGCSRSLTAHPRMGVSSSRPGRSRQPSRSQTGRWWPGRSHCRQPRKHERRPRQRAGGSAGDTPNGDTPITAPHVPKTAPSVSPVTRPTPRASRDPCGPPREHQHDGMCTRASVTL